MEMLGEILEIREVSLTAKDCRTGEQVLSGNKGSRAGLSSMINRLRGYGGYKGYLVQTDKHKYHVIIEDGQSCCENWGYITTNEDLSYFVGAELYKVELTDTALNKKPLEDIENYLVGGGGIVFVDFTTSKGVFQLVVYNAHNGYYGHAIMVCKDYEIIHDDSL